MRPDASENSQISPSTIVRAARAAGSHPHLASVLLQGRKSANIHASSGVIWGMSDSCYLVANGCYSPGSIKPMLGTTNRSVTDPVGQGLVPNLAHPGGNLTGFTSFEFSIGTKWLEALKQTAPHVTRLALVFDPQSAPFAELFMRPIKAAALSLSVEPIGAAVRDPADVDRVFDTLAREP